MEYTETCEKCGAKACLRKIPLFPVRLNKNRKGKKVGEVFPEFDLFIYGGVNFEPYRAKFENLIGRKVPSIELFPASEGFFAYQDKQDEKGMLLRLNSGIFYEFIKADDFFSENPKRLTIGEVEINVNYVMVISTNAGLWAYNLGDTVMFTSTKPYRVIVSGRIKHFTSAFGEHVIAKEVDADYYSLSVLSPYYGTKLYFDLMDQGYELDKKPWEYFYHQSGDLMVNDTISPAVLKEYLSLNDLNRDKDATGALGYM